MVAMDLGQDMDPAVPHVDSDIRGVHENATNQLLLTVDAVVLGLDHQIKIANAICLHAQGQVSYCDKQRFVTQKGTKFGKPGKKSDTSDLSSNLYSIKPIFASFCSL